MDVTSYGSLCVSLGLPFSVPAHLSLSFLCYIIFLLVKIQVSPRKDFDV